MKFEGLNQYRVMWLMVFFDLPVETKKQRKAATAFRKELIDDGFSMFQFSIYLRHCASRENTEVHIRRVKSRLPEFGHVGILRVTDRQFGEMELFFARRPATRPAIPQQLEMF